MKKTIAIIGGGSASLFLAAFLDEKRYDITIYEKNKAVGRKFLVAGKGGFNLTHSEVVNSLIERYSPPHFLKEAILGFDNLHLRDWLAEIGVPTFIGSSKRVFPQKGIKPIEVLNALLRVLKNKEVKIRSASEWKGWNSDKHLIFDSDSIVKSDYTVFALGGASWQKTGSDGTWLEIFAEQGIRTIPFEPANCAYNINWPKKFIAVTEGAPLKNIAMRCGKETQKGEAVITRFGLEGNAIYALSPEIQKELRMEGEAQIFIDLKPGLSENEIFQRIAEGGNKNITDVLKEKVKLNPSQIKLLKAHLSKSEFLTAEILSLRIKNLPLKILAAAPIDEAISTTGGISLSAVSKNFELKEMENTFCIGEMLDWNAPTGGYLLQACFSMGVHLARYLNTKN